MSSNNAKHSKTNYPGLVASYDTQPGNEVGLFDSTLIIGHVHATQTRLIKHNISLASNVCSLYHDT